jgi:hypothetical protein
VNAIFLALFLLRHNQPADGNDMADVIILLPFFTEGSAESTAAADNDCCRVWHD